MEDFKYLIWVGFFAAVWLAFIYLRPDLKRQSVVVGLFIAVLTPFAGWWYLQDYWNPAFAFEITGFGLRTGLEEILLGFFMGAISAIGADVVFRKRPVRVKKALPWYFPLIMFTILYDIGAALVTFTDLNSIYASFIAFFAGIALLGILRKDLLWNGFLSGIFFGFVLFLSYVVWMEMLFPGTIREWWLIENISGILILGIPIEEAIWGFTWGWVAGMFYETWQGLGFADRKKTAGV